MEKYYVSKETLKIYNDCSSDSKIVSELPVDDMFRITDEAGLWKFIRSKRGVQGWINIFKDGKYLIEEDLSVHTGNICIGDTIVIDDGLEFVKDYYNHTLRIKENGKDIKFVVEEIVQNPVRVEFRVGDIMYSFELHKVKYPGSMNLRLFDIDPYSPLGQSEVQKKRMEEIEQGIPIEKSKAMDINNKKAVDEQNKAAGESEANRIEKEQQEITKNLIGQAKDIYNKIVHGGTSITAEELNTTRINDLRGVFGMPYQFLPIADMRLISGNGPDTSFNAIGRKYLEKIIARMPLFLITPGRAEFMARYSKDKKKTVMSELASLDGSGNEKRLESILQESGEYYNFYNDWATYYKVVNPLCRIAATLLRLYRYRIPGTNTPITQFNWANNSNNYIQKMFSYKGASAYYINSDPQVSESFSNESTKPSIADKINTLSEKMREMQFLIGAASSDFRYNHEDSKDGRGLGASVYNMLTGGNKSGGGGGETSAGSVIGSIASGMSEVVAGSKMRFPEIWSDSSFSKDYSINIRLISPDSDNLSVYLNIIVPLIHLISLAGPRATGPNTYGSPFLIRCFYRGFFNINLGIITSMSITKGGEGKWSYQNVPVEVDVSITIKDLYDLMCLSINNNDNFNTDVSILSNNLLMDYLCNMCGVNFSEVDLVRTLVLYKIIVEEKFRDLPTNVGNTINQWVYNQLTLLAGYR